MEIARNTVLVDVVSGVGRLDDGEVPGVLGDVFSTRRGHHYDILDAAAPAPLEENAGLDGEHHAAAEDRVVGRVEVRARRLGGTVEFIVADNGMGIAAEHLPHVFERFYRAPTARKEDGTGLGLAIARWIAEEHAGRLEVESTPGKGSTFTFWMPSLVQQKVAAAKALA